RFSKMVKGMPRHQVPEEVIAYHVLHTKIDVVHGNSLVNRVLLPLATQNPAATRDICIGCLIRFNVETDYYESARQVMENLRQSLQYRGSAGYPTRLAVSRGRPARPACAAPSAFFMPVRYPSPS
ncbi:hypothetical protein C3E98_035210, partial [Pseudomonas sp. MWU13-2625]